MEVLAFRGFLSSMMNVIEANGRENSRQPTLSLSPHVVSISRPFTYESTTSEKDDVKR